jgi:serine/threonine-protein kinase
MGAPFRPEREHLLDEILGAYLQGVDSGQPPNRAEILARYPDLEPELTAFFADTDRLNRYTDGLNLPGDSTERTTFATPQVDGPPHSADHEQSDATAGFDNYELIHVIARGGMGIVYRARDRRLNRQVALKMILASQALSETDRRRFHNEAEAVASLDHSHIVPIYDVGEHRGLPYFSMRLVPGGSLASQLTRFVLEPKAAARLLVPVARAMHYAHQRGVLHRDLKPSNVLIDADEQPYVTDFGLAKRLLSNDSGSGDATLTQSGAIVGTPGYMAPEQAQGKRSAVTTATDIYGLGSILYALLTGGPPFSGDDIWETLEALRERPPQAPHELNPRVERDLELICLKCLDKDPARRYPSAEILAGELERYLDGRPLVYTRPIRTAELVWRWYMRHRLLASLAGALILAMLLLTAGSIIAAVRFKALSDRERQSRQRAEESRALASDVATQSLTLISESEEFKTHGLERLRKELLSRARDFWEKFTDQDSTDPAVQAERGKAYVRLGTIASALDSNSEAKAALGQAQAVFEQLTVACPDVPDYRDELAGALHQLGNLYQKTGQAPQAEAAYSEARRIRQSLDNEYPGVARYRDHLGRTIFQCALQEQQSGRLKQAEKGYEQARQTFAQLVQEEPAAADYQEALAGTFFNLGTLFLAQKAPARARENFESARPIYESLLRMKPQKPEYQSAVARTSHRLGSLYREAHQFGRADDAYNKASVLTERLYRDHPNVPGHRLNLVALLHARGKLYFDNERFEESRPFMEKAISIGEDLVHEYRDVPLYREELGKNYYDTACFYSLWSKHVSKDASLPEPVKDKLQKQFRAAAIAFLGKAQAIGFFKQRTMSETLKTDSDLDPLRGREDFKKLVAEIDKDSAAQK